METRKKINNINYIVEVLKYKDQLLDILPHLYSITQEVEADDYCKIKASLGYISEKKEVYRKSLPQTYRQNIKGKEMQ